MWFWQLLHSQTADLREYALRIANIIDAKSAKRSKLVQYAYEGHEISWKEVKVLQNEPNATRRK
jgi:hypothetical protein